MAEDEVFFIGTANVNVPGLNAYEAGTYRRELIHALREPGMEFDMVGEMSDADRAFYREKLKEVDAHLKTFSER
jgi:hypothetical protein